MAARVRDAPYEIRFRALRPMPTDYSGRMWCSAGWVERRRVAEEVGEATELRWGRLRRGQQQQQRGTGILNPAPAVLE